jgi:hypothetical protein
VTLSPVVRRLLLAIALLLLMGLAWTGLSGGLHQIPQSHTRGERVQTAAQLAYGLLSLLSILTSFRYRRWAPLVLACWAISVTVAAGFASVVWGGTTLTIGLLSAAASLLIALAILGLLRAGLAG